jgi:hypothetical protein
MTSCLTKGTSTDARLPVVKSVNAARSNVAEKIPAKDAVTVNMSAFTYAPPGFDHPVVSRKSVPIHRLILIFWQNPFHSDIFSNGTSTQSSEEAAADKEQWHSSATITADPAPKVRVIEHTAPSLSNRLGDSDYYIRLAEKRLTALSPEQTNAPREKRRKTSIGSETLQDLINRRGTPGAVIAGLDVNHWVEVLSIYQDEIGLQYPYLDIEDLKRKINLAKQDNLGTDTLRSRGDERLDDLALMVHAIVSILADSAAGDVVNALAEEIFTTVTGRAQLNGADKDDLSLLILAVRPFSHTSNATLILT